MDFSIKILIVDDMSAMRRIISNALKQIGFTNLTVTDDGTTALNALKNDNFDLVISDWNMPKMTGIELLKTVRGMSEYKNVPFVMVTAESGKSNVVLAVQAGVSQYIVKPFTVEQLTEKLKKVLS